MSGDMEHDRNIAVLIPCYNEEATIAKVIDDFRAQLDPVPEGVTFRTSLRGKVDVAVLFVTARRELVTRIDAGGRAIFPSGGLWVAWPKRASGVPTDMTEDVVRELALPLGLVDNKVCAIDATWSGLRVVWRRELRSAG